MSQKKNEGIRFPTEIRVVGSYTDRLLIDLAFLSIVNCQYLFSRCVCSGCSQNLLLLVKKIHKAETNIVELHAFQPGIPLIHHFHIRYNAPCLPPPLLSPKNRKENLA